MFPWSTVHVMNSYVDNVCIHENDKNIPQKNVPTPLPLPYNKIYPRIVPGIISYANTSHVIIVFFGAVHSSCVGISILNLTCLNIEALFLLYDPLQFFWNHTGVVYRRGIIHTSSNKVGTFWTPFRNCFL